MINLAQPSLKGKEGRILWIPDPNQVPATRIAFECQCWLVGEMVMSLQASLYLRPENELRLLAQGISGRPTDSEFRFEPREPSFEMVLMPAVATGHAILQWWQDMGRDHASWEARGVRLLCTQDDLLGFGEQLEAVSRAAEVGNV